MPNPKWEQNVQSTKKTEIFHVKTKFGRKYSLNFAKKDHCTTGAINQKNNTHILNSYN